MSTSRSTHNSSSMISTTALAKHFDLPAKTLFTFLTEKSWINRIDNHWRLTGKGEFEGGEYINSKKYGEYIGWPQNIVDHSIFQEMLDLPMSAAALGARYNISSHRFNALLAELGWQKRFHKGWTITHSGKKHGGVEKEDNASGVPYTVWARGILVDNSLKKALEQITLTSTIEPTNTKQSEKTQKSLDLSKISLPEYSRDGRRPDNKEHHDICNWLYLMNVVYAYRWSLPEVELGACDFYLPAANLHLECWQEKEDAKSMSEKIARIDYYKQENLAYIELKSEQLNELDAALPKLLLKYGITVY